MPSNTLTRPDFLTKLATYNAINGVNATFSEMKKTAARIAKAFDARPDPSLTADEYFLDYSDTTGETAVAHVMNPTECTHHESIQLRLDRKAS